MSNNLIGTRAVKQYCRQIRRKLACSRKTKRELLDRIIPDLEEFAELHPHATVDDLCERFGSPQEVAESYITTIPARELRKAMKKFRFVTVIILITCFIGLLFAGLYRVYVMYSLLTDEPAPVVQSVEQGKMLMGR